jgi:hypothetical protein
VALFSVDTSTANFMMCPTYDNISWCVQHMTTFHDVSNKWQYFASYTDIPALFITFQIVSHLYVTELMLICPTHNPILSTIM